MKLRDAHHRSLADQLQRSEANRAAMQQGRCLIPMSMIRAVLELLEANGYAVMRHDEVGACGYAERHGWTMKEPSWWRHGEFGGILREAGGWHWYPIETVPRVPIGPFDSLADAVDAASGHLIVDELQDEPASVSDDAAEPAAIADDSGVTWRGWLFRVLTHAIRAVRHIVGSKS